MTQAPTQTVPLREAAQVLGIDPRTAYRLVARGDFPVPVLRVGTLLKVSRVQLERFIESGGTPEAAAS